MIASASLFQLASGLATRRLEIGFLSAFIAGVILVPALLVVLTVMTDVGMRITSHLYLDDSADVRIIQWRVLNLLNARDILFGVSLDGVDLLKAQVGLTAPGDDIENPWLLTFLGLGVIGFPFLVAAIFLFLLHLGRRTNTPIGWLVVVATLLICSTNNSLGRKTPDLFFLTGVMAALSGFTAKQRSESSAGHLANTSSHIVTALMPPQGVRALSDRPRGGFTNGLGSV
jgi:hypothetical protein